MFASKMGYVFKSRFSVCKFGNWENASPVISKNLPPLKLNVSKFDKPSNTLLSNFVINEFVIVIITVSSKIGALKAPDSIFSNFTSNMMERTF